MYRRVDDFLRAYEQTRQSTARVLAAIDDACLDQRVVDDHRTIREIAWHVAVTIPEMMQRTGLPLSSVDHEAPPPATAAEIVAAYDAASTELAAAVRAEWTDATLEETDTMYGQDWARGFTLTILIQHEVHHRGQLTVLLRQAGKAVPGVCGPAKEEWTQFGMEPPAY